MSKPLRVLFVEDDANDVALITRELSHGGFELSSKVVGKPDEFPAALMEDHWDIVLAEYALPKFDGREALRIARKHDVDLPFILVSGKFDAETVVELLKEGAQDFVIKSNLGRLAPAVERELLEAEERRERRRADETLRHSSRWLEMALDSAELSPWEWDIESGDMIFTEREVAVLGYPLEEIREKYRDWDSLLHPEDRDLAHKTLDAFLSGENAFFELEHRLLCKKGKYKWVISQGKIVEWDERGKPRRALGIHQDITVRKERERQQALEHLRLETGYKSSFFGMFDFDIRNNDLRIFGFWKEMLGYDVDETLSQQQFLLDKVHPEDRAGVSRLFRDILKGKASPALTEFDFRVQDSQGNWRWMLTHGGGFVGDDSGKKDRFLANLIDITTRKQAEAELRQSEERFRSLFESIINPVSLNQVVPDEAGKPIDAIFIEVNPAFEIMTGLKRDSIIGKRESDIFPSLGKAWAALCGKVAKSGKPVKAEQHLSETGLDFEVTVYSPTRGQFAVIRKDITQQRKAEAAVQLHQQKIQQQNEEMASQNEELRILHEDLQLQVEELRTAEEELQNQNEELRTAEEELQRQNEELRAAEEELQRQNEEITVAYDDLQNAQKELGQSEERFHGLFENLNTAASLFEPIFDQKGRLADLRYLTVNSMLERALGRTRQDIEGRLYSELFPLSERNPVSDIYEKVALSGEPYKGELYSPVLKGYYDMTIYRPDPGHLAVLFFDVSERVKMQNALSESEKRFHSLFEHMINGFVLYEIIYDEAGARDVRYIDVNPAFEKMMGMKREEVIGRTLMEVFPKLPREHIKDYETVAGGGSPMTTVRQRYDTGQIFEATIFSPSQGRVAVIFQDITERVKAEEAVKAERRRLYDVLETLPVYVAILDTDYRVPFANRFFRESFGESHGRRCYEFLFDRDTPCESCETYKVMETKAPHHWEWTGPNGRSYDIYDFPFYEPDGTMNILEMGIDITERKKAEDAVQESEERYRTLFTEMLNGFALHEMIFDEAGQPADYRFLEVNPEFEKLTGLRAEDVVGKTVREVIPSVESFWIERFGKVVQTGEPIQFEGRSGALGKYYEARAFRPTPGKFAVIFDDITERFKAREALRQSEAHYRALFDTMLTAYAVHEMIFDESGVPVDARFLDVNPAWEQIMGLSRDQAVGKTVYELWPNTEPYWMETYGRVVTTGATTTFENYFAATDSFYQVIAYRPAPGQYAINFLDITERRKAEGEIRSLARFPEENPNPVLRINTENKILYANPASDSLLGAWNIDGSGSLPDYAFRRIMEECSIDAKRDFEMECGDRLYWFLVVQAPDRRDISIYGKDITEHKKAEQALRESEERFRIALKAADIVVFNTDKDLRYTWMYNPQFGYTLEGILGKRDDELVPPEDARESIAFKQKVIDLGVGAHGEVEVVQGGQRHVFDIVAEPLRDESGELVGLTAATFEITKRKEMEDALWRVNELLETMFFSIDFHLAYLDRDMNFIRVNRAYAAGNGHLPEYFAGKNHFELFPHTENEKIFREVIATGKPYITYAKPFVFPEHPEWGATYWDWSLQPVFERDGTVGGLVLSLIDVTRREKAVQEVAQKNEALAIVNNELQQFAYVASHDLQEPLRMIASYLQLIEKRYKDKLDSDANEFIAFAVDGAKRLQNMINSLLEYSRVETRGTELRPVSSEASLEHALDNLSLAVRESGAEVTADPLPVVKADGQQLTQLFQNLIGNAIKFRREEPPRVYIGVALGKGEWVFEVRDNGIGIENQYFDRIFNIFQRLNGHDYQGTGIGLAVCKRIIERHGGRIWIESTPGQGSVFFFTLPAERRADDVD